MALKRWNTRRIMWWGVAYGAVAAVWNRQWEWLALGGEFRTAVIIRALSSILGGAAVFAAVSGIRNRFAGFRGGSSIPSA